MKLDLKELISKLTDKQTWKLVGSKTGWNNALTLPADYTELQIRIYNDAKTGGFSKHFIREQLTQTAVTYRDGYGFSQGTNLININVSITEASVAFYTQDSVYQNNCELTAYYK